MLYLIYQKRKIRNDSGVKSKLKRAFHYKSDGHLYHDLNVLTELGLIKEKNGFLAITKKGRGEFTLLEILRTTAVIIAFYGIYIFTWTVFRYGNTPLEFQSLYYSVSLTMIAISILLYYTFRSFKPLPPDPSEKIE